MQFLKYHALGNDYLVLRNELFGEQTPDWAVEPDLDAVIRICDRNRGLGSDGILVGEKMADAEFRLRIFNPDGSEAEKSGNGLRIFVRSLWDHDQVGEKPFAIQTLGGRVQARVLEGGAEVEVEMGRISFNSSAIPVKGEEREVIRETLEVDGRSLEFCAATVG
ncbi:MAG: diaminopimelate epimerase, partial [SAR324 cluster bacterium]|nr:diaminopimelate epimerase [SAR324 cluster bacterium]